MRRGMNTAPLNWGAVSEIPGVKHGVHSVSFAARTRGQKTHTSAPRRADRMPR